VDFVGGPILIMPNTKSALKGVDTGDLRKVFGAKLPKAIKESLLRRIELKLRHGAKRVGINYNGTGCLLILSTTHAELLH
jgi:hypothetical protein